MKNNWYTWFQKRYEVEAKKKPLDENSTADTVYPTKQRKLLFDEAEERNPLTGKKFSVT